MAGLSGMKEVCQYCKRSEATILQWVKEQGFPATKIGGSWESDTELIDQWRKGAILANIGENITKSKKKIMPKKAVKRKKP